MALQQVVYSPSVDIRPEWVVVEQIPFTSLSKLSYQVGQHSEKRQDMRRACSYPLTSRI